MSSYSMVAPIVRDGLSNVMTGAGTSADKRQHSQWVKRYADQVQITEAYRASWLMRKVVDLPPFDMTRAWRDWQAEPDQIELLEKEETRLKVRHHIRHGLTLGRLGGGIIILGVDQGQPEAPLRPEGIARGGLRYLKPLSRWQVTLGDLIEDVNDDDFGEPEFFILKGRKSGREVRVHRSRCLVFKGEFNGGGTIDGNRVGSTTSDDAYWGDSIVEVVNDAVINATSAQDEIAGLISEAKIDIFGIPNLLGMMGDPEAEKRVMRRLELAQLGKSTHRALVKDADESFEQRQVSWAGMPEVIRIFLSIVAGAADIPATRLLGKSPDGMNATGESDQADYDRMIESRQSSDLAPALSTLDDVLIPSALGTRPPEVYYSFAPLRVLTETQQAEVESKEAASVQAIVNAGLIPEEALAQSVANRMMESGRWPGLEKALEDMGEKWWEVAAEEDEDDPSALTQPGGPQPSPEPSPGSTGASGGNG